MITPPPITEQARAPHILPQQSWRLARRRFTHQGGAWRLVSMVIALLAALPLLMLLPAWLTAEDEIWRHLADTLLVSLLRNTAVLILGVGLGVFVIGVGLAWLTAMCEFPGRRIFDWALMLPLGIPTYVLAFVAIGFLDFSGPVQSTLRSLFATNMGTGTLWFPPIRSEGGVIAVMVLALYPYVYMLARAAFLGQGRNVFESGRVLGLNPWQAFFRISLPMARPAITAGVALALMETLADFGAVAIFNYDTFTTALYKAWFDLFNLPAAAQLSTLLLLFVALALMGERRSRGRARFYGSGKRPNTPRYQLTGKHAWLASGSAAVVLTLAFIIPVAQLAVWTATTGMADFDARYMEFVSHTLLLGVIGALLTLTCALLLATIHKQWPDRITRYSTQLATLGYAMPGAVLAVGIMLLFTWIDKGIDRGINALTGEDTTGLLLSSSVIALLFAYVVRFLAVAHGPVESALERITPSIQQAARSLGAGHREVLWRVYLPILRPGLLTAALLVFVDIMKEMPATLLLRPFDWDTLAIRIFEMTSEGEWERAALPALTLVLVGLIPVILLVRHSGK